MANYVAGVDIGGSSIKFGVFEEGRELVYRSSAAMVIGDADAAVEIIKKLVEDCPYHIDKLGADTPGTVLLPQGTVNAANLYWKNVPLRAMLNRALKMPIWVDNDAQTQLAAEWWSGACKGLSSAIYLAFGTGVGGAMLINGHPWRGHRNTAGEIGHIITHADGIPCPCGLKGCYERYASAAALCRMGGKDNAKEIIDAAREGDPEMLKVLHEYLHEVAIGIASLNMVFRPEAFVLGGGISAAGDIFLHTLNEEITKVAGPYAEEINASLALAVHRNDAGIRGAAALAMTCLE